MDSQEGIDQVYTLNYFDQADIDKDINAQSRQLPGNCQDPGKG
jgi:hypothetical protein